MQKNTNATFFLSEEVEDNYDKPDLLPFKSDREATFLLVQTVEQKPKGLVPLTTAVVFSN